MKPGTPAPRSALLPLRSRRERKSQRESRLNLRLSLQRSVALGMALLLLPLAQIDALAQEQLPQPSKPSPYHYAQPDTDSAQQPPADPVQPVYSARTNNPQQLPKTPSYQAQQQPAQRPVQAAPAACSGSNTRRSLPIKFSSSTRPSLPIRLSRMASNNIPSSRATRASRTASSLMLSNSIRSRPQPHRAIRTTRTRVLTPTSTDRHKLPHNHYRPTSRLIRDSLLSSLNSSLPPSLSIQIRWSPRSWPRPPIQRRLSPPTTGSSPWAASRPTRLPLPPTVNPPGTQA